MNYFMHVYVAYACRDKYQSFITYNKLNVLLKYTSINPLVTDSLYLACMSKFSIKKEGIIEKIFYERRAYGSVDGRSHS